MGTKKKNATSSNGTHENHGHNRSRSNSNHKRRPTADEVSLLDEFDDILFHECPPDHKETKEERNNKKVFLCFFFMIFVSLLAVFSLRETVDPDDQIVSSITESIRENEFLTNFANLFVERPGVLAANQGLSADGPVVLIPGIISTGLEVWQGKACAKKHFRERFWGTSLMIRKIILTRDCWKDHISMNLTTWSDPDGIKLRPATGLGAADYLVGDYWVWGKMIENLADVGYDINNMYMAAYDWRLPFHLLEERDHYLSMLKSNIEHLVRTQKKKVTLIAHSMGSNVVFFFLKWVEHPTGGNGGPSWVDTYVENFVNIAGPMLGVPKSVSTLLSGEMRDTAELNSVMQFIKENLLSKDDILKIMRSFGSVPSMIPMGGNMIWGDHRKSPERLKHSQMVNFGATWRDHLHTDHAGELQNIESCEPDDKAIDRVLNQNQIDEISRKSYTIDESIDLLRHVAPNYMSIVDKYYTHGFDSNPRSLENDSRSWANPLQAALPYAPNLKIYCLYGYGKLAERSYHYKPSSEQCSNIPISIDTTVNNLEENITFGIQLTQGDGTVPLISLGFVCAKAWRDPRFNPGGSEVIIREYAHQSKLGGGSIEDMIVRGGLSTADHVDIMGNYAMLRDVVNIVTSNTSSVVERIVSPIKELVDHVPWH